VLDTSAGPTQATSSADEGLVRALGLGSGVLFVIGSVIGSGIFLTTGSMAAVMPSATLILIAWLLGGVISLCGGLTYAELGAMYPRSGGVYVYLREAFGSLPAFLYGWAALAVFFTGGIAAVAIGFAEYVSYFIPAVSTAHVLWQWPTPLGNWPISAAQLLAVACILTLGGINYIGVRSGNRVNIVMTVAKVSGLAALPVLAILFAKSSPEWTPVVPSVPRPAVAFGISMIAVLWANDAWYCITWIAGEMKDPARNLPRALLLGIGSITIVYVTVNLAYLFALPISDLKGVTRVAERAATELIGPTGARFVALTVVISTFGNIGAGILASARLLFAMARDGVFLPRAQRVHPTYHTPHIAIVAVAIWSAVLALSGTYEQLFTYVMFASILLHLLGAFAVIRLRRKQPQRSRPYRVWGYPVVPAVFILASSAFVLNTLLQRPRESLAGLGLLAIGLPAYWYSKR
jgi:APA family basic amino acid/polyamine antiporter